MLRFHHLATLAFITSFAALSACAAPADEAMSDEAAIESDSSLGEELESNEDALVKQIAEAARQQVSQSMTQGSKAVAKRAAHAKAHGCVTGSFTVNENVPSDLAVGTFQAGRRYDTWVRFSNGMNADDRKSDSRGMAIKLLGVDGPRLLPLDEKTAHTHDIILANHDRFFLKDISTYVKFMDTVTEKGNPLQFFISWNPLDWHVHEAILAHEFTTQKISSPLTSRYWSVTAYKLGNQAVKYSARPCGGVDTSGDHEDDENYLAGALKRGLSSGSGACFDFMIQRRAEPIEMPVEDATTRWSEDAAPFVSVARIQIPPQTFDSPAQQTYCENLSFSPWHGTPEHRPLGRINRTRKVVYEAISSVRHTLNGVAPQEPTDLRVR